MSFDPWNGRTTIRLGDPSIGDVSTTTTTTAPSRPPAPAGLFYTTVSGPRKAESGGLHWAVQWKPRGATPAVGWTVQHAKAPAGSTGASEPAAPTLPTAPSAQARPTLDGSTRSISRHLTATWNATGGSKTTTIAT